MFGMQRNAGDARHRGTVRNETVVADSSNEHRHRRRSIALVQYCQSRIQVKEFQTRLGDSKTESITRLHFVARFDSGNAFRLRRPAADENLVAVLCLKRILHYDDWRVQVKVDKNFGTERLNQVHVTHEN